MDKSAYRVFRVRKANGRGWRELLEPNPELKEKQRNILMWLMAHKVRPSPYCHAFVKRRSIITNASLHTGKKVIVRIDIQNFFPSITKKQVIWALRKEGIKSKDAEDIAEICTINEYLPQGSPVSPLLSNLAFKEADYRLAGLARKWKQGNPEQVTYSRYADDLIFSSDFSRLNLIIHPVKSILEEYGFQINPEKTKVLRYSNRQSVTGIVVNKKPNILRNDRRNFRAKLHNIKKAILKGEHPEYNVRSLLGKISYYNLINPLVAKHFQHDLKEILNLQQLVNKFAS